MKISRIALASLISFGVLGGASLNASANHTHYQRILWNKTMAHQKVALKNGKGIIWNKPYKTAKNSKITYRLAHKKGPVMTTLRHMKVKNGSIYYFVKAGKISGWINKKSVKLIKNSAGTKTTIAPNSAPIQSNGTPVPNTPSNTLNTTTSNIPAKNSQNSSSSNVPNSSTTQPTSSNSKTSDSINPITATTKVNSFIYSDNWDGDNPDSNKTNKSLGLLPRGEKVEIIRTDKTKNGTALLVRSKDGVYGYMNQNELNFDSKDIPSYVLNYNSANNVTSVPNVSDKSVSKSDSKETGNVDHSTEATVNQNNLFLYKNSWDHGKTPTDNATKGLIANGTKVYVLNNDKSRDSVLVITNAGETGYINRESLTFNK